MTKFLLFVCAAISLAAPSAYSQTIKVPATSALNAHIPKGYGRTALSFEPNRGQTDGAVKFLSRGDGYTTYLEPTVATLALHKSEGVAVRNGRHAGEVAASKRETLRMTLVNADAGASMSGERALPGYVTYMHGADPRNWKVALPTYAATRVTNVYPGISLVYYGTQRELEYDFVVSPNADPGKIRLAIDGAHAVLESSGELRLRTTGATLGTDVLFRKPVVYQRIDGRQQAIESSFKIAASGEVGFRLGAYDHSRELVIDPVISYASYYGGSGEDEINGSTVNANGQLYAVGQTFSPTLPSGAGEFQPTRMGNKNSNYHDGFVTKFSADGSTVLWTTYLGGSQDDYANGVAVGSADEAYVVGTTSSCGADNSIPGVASNTAVEFPFTSDALQRLCSPVNNGAGTQEINGGSADAYLVKLSSDGKTLLYGTPLGGSQNDFANSVVLDTTGRPYIVGETQSTQYYKCATIGPHCGDVPAYPIDNHGNADIGLSNYPTTANAFYSNTTESQQYATTDPNSGNTGGPQDEQAFITVLSADLHSFVYSSLIGGGVIGGCGNGACNTNGIAITVNNAGQGFIGGNTSSAHWPTTAGAFAAACDNAGNANSQCPMTGWLAGFDPTKSGTASLLFATYMTGSSGGKDANGNTIYPGSDVYGLANDSVGNVIATGDTSANNFPTTSATLQPTCDQFGDGNGNSLRCASAYITKLSSTGKTVWSTYYGPQTSPGNFVIGSGVALDASDNVYIVGLSTSPSLPLKNPISTNPAQNSDAFVLELSPDASKLLLGTYIGSVGGIEVNNNSLHLDSKLNAYFSGYIGYCTNCTNVFPATAGAFATTGLGGSADGWVMKLATQQQTSSTDLSINPSSASPGTSITFTASVTGVDGLPVPTGTVALANGSTSLGSITLTDGKGTFSSSTLAGGTYSVIGTYSGDVVYAGSASTAQTLAITATPAVALTATPSTATVGTNITLKATVTASSGTPTGTVYFMDGSTTLGSAVLTSGVASYSTTTLSAGTHSITARYGGDSNFGTFTSAATTVTISALPAPTIALTATPSTAIVGNTIVLGAKLSGTGSTPTGTVTFLDGTTTIGTGTLASGGASLSVSTFAIGTHSITLKYGGDSNYATATSSVVSVTINALSKAVVALTATPSSTTAGATVVLAAAVSGSGGTPTGTVTFLDGTTTLGTGTLSSGAATLSVSTLAVGTHSITLKYGGDSTFAAATSSAVTVTITAVPPGITIAAAPTSLTVKRGSSGSIVITVTPVGGFAGTLSFSCGTLPSQAACVFSPKTLTFTAASSKAQSSTLTFSTSVAAEALLQHAPRRPGAPFAPVILTAFLLLPLAFNRRVRRVRHSLTSWSLVLFAVLSLAAVAGVTGCGSNGPATTPAGTYTVPVTVSGGATTASVNLSITVQ
jgi:hypothetical protein